MEKKSKRKLLLEIIKKKSIILGKNSNMINPNGSRATWLIDMRATFLDRKGIDLVADIFWEKFSAKYPFQVGGQELGAVPLVSAIMMKGVQIGKPVNGFIVRKERKTKGLCRIVEGKISKDAIILVDDLMNSASTIKEIISKIEGHKEQIRDIFVVVDFENKKSRKNIENTKINITSIYKLRELGISNIYKENNTKKELNIKWILEAINPNYQYETPKSTPVLDGNNVYFGNHLGEFLAVNQKSGKIIWKFAAGKSSEGKGIFSSAVISNDKIFFGTYNGNFHCLNCIDGKEIWRFDDCDWIGSSPAISSELGLVFVGIEHSLRGKKGSFIALDLNTGKKKWEYIVSELLHGSPVFCKEKKIVAIGTNDKDLLLFNAKNGRLLWKFGTGGEIRYAPVFDLKRNAVMFGSHDGKIYIVNIESGQEIFSHKTENSIYSTPLVFRDKAYSVSTDKHIYLIDLKKMKFEKRIYIGSKLYSSPKVINNKIYFGSNAGIIWELDPRRKVVVARKYLSERITNAIAYNKKNGLFYVLMYENTLVCLSEKRKK